MGIIGRQSGVKSRDSRLNHARKIRIKSVGCGISGAAVDNVGVSVPIKFGDSRSNCFRDI